jgi:peptidyl-prolyl cis-trans isomerase D
MLKIFRDNLKHLKWVLWIVIFAFLIFYIPDFVRQAGTGTAAATVGGEQVSYAEFKRAYRLLEAQLGPQYTPELARQLGLAKLALDRLVNQKILLLEARKLGLSVSDDELREAILEEFRDSQGNFVGQEIYRNQLLRLGYSVAAYEQDLRDGLLLGKLIEVLRANLHVTEKEVEEAYRQQVDRAKIRYLLVPGDRFAGEVQVSDEEAAAYFAEHQERYRLPERRHFAYLLVDAAQVRAAAPVEESELVRYYDEHKSEFTRLTQARVRHIFLKTDGRSTAEAQQALEDARRRIEGGADFAQLARELSEDPTSASNGGDLGVIGRGLMPPEFDEAVFGPLTENPEPGAGAPVGQLVGPVTASFGVHLIEVTERREGGLQPFPEVREQVRARRVAERLPELIKQKARTVLERIRQEELSTVEELQALAQEDPTLSLLQPPPTGRDELVPGLGRPEAFLEAAFSLEPGKVSDPVEVPRGRALILIKEVLPPRAQELAEVREQIERELTRTRQLQLAVERLAEARRDMDGGKTLDQVAAELAVTPQETGEFGPRGAVPGLGFNPQVVQAAMALKPGQVGGPFEATGGALLFEVVERTTWDRQQFEEAKEATREQVRENRLNQLLASVVQKRLLDLDVHYDPRALGQDDTGSAG